MSRSWVLITIHLVSHGVDDGPSVGAFKDIWTGHYHEGNIFCGDKYRSSVGSKRKAGHSSLIANPSSLPLRLYFPLLVHWRVINVVTRAWHLEHLSYIWIWRMCCEATWLYNAAIFSLFIYTFRVKPSKPRYWGRATVFYSKSLHPRLRIRYLQEVYVTSSNQTRDIIADLPPCVTESALVLEMVMTSHVLFQENYTVPNSRVLDGLGCPLRMGSSWKCTSACCECEKIASIV